MRHLTIALVSVAAVALLAGSAQATTIDVAGDSVWPENVAGGVGVSP